MPEPNYANPFSSLTARVLAAITEYPPLLALIPNDTAGIQAFDEDIDVRGSMEGASIIGPRIELEPATSTTNFDHTSSSTQFVRRYTVALFGGTVNRKTIEAMEWHLTVALNSLYMELLPGTSDPVPEIEPLEVLDVKIVSTDPEQITKLALREYEAVCDVVIIADVSHEAMRAWTPPAP